MADWIKLSYSTPVKPEVAFIARATKLDTDTVLGKLLRIWIWFDLNSVDGVITLGTDADVDAVVGKEGFARAMRDAGWLTTPDCGAGIQATNFDRHNGSTGKKRAQIKERVAKSRNAPSVTSSLSLLSYSSSFNRFWDAWPSHHRKGNKPKCFEVWKATGCEDRADHIVRHVEWSKATDGWRDDGGKYIPAPLVYLNQHRWDMKLDQPSTSSAPAQRRNVV
jgi:hypothetical protein